MNFGMCLGVGICAFVVLAAIAIFVHDGVLRNTPADWFDDDIEFGIVIFGAFVGIVVGVIAFLIGLAVHLWM